MILYRPFPVTPPVKAAPELREGQALAPEQTQPGLNPYNGVLEQEAGQARQLTRNITQRTSTTTTTAGAGWAPTIPAQEPFHRPFNVAAVGDNLVISGADGYRIAIHQIELYNTVQQTIRLLDGSVDLIGPLVNFPAQAGLNLRWQDEPHFKLSYGQPFKINLSAGQVTGFVKYRMEG